MQDRQTSRLPQGIISVLQTPFDEHGAVDYESMGRLIEAAIRDGVHGFLAPAVASEVSCLSREERQELIGFISKTVSGRVAFIVGASSPRVEECRDLVQSVAEVTPDACLIAVPEGLYQQPAKIPEFFRSACDGCALPLLVQDLQWNGPGMSLETIARLREAVPQLVGLKIETVPAGPKYTAVRQAFGRDFFIAGGWAVPQMIEALDRSVDAMMPESSMIKVYGVIDRHYREGRRDEARALFRQLLPVLAFTNQEISLSIAFFKCLLVRDGVFRTAHMRCPFVWDEFNQRIADELIEHYLAVRAALD